MDSIKDCYAALVLIHSIWKPVTGRFKDYISIPKANMYQSRTPRSSVRTGERIEVQIRTEEMHKVGRVRRGRPLAVQGRHKKASRAPATPNVSPGFGRSWTGSGSCQIPGVHGLPALRSLPGRGLRVLPLARHQGAARGGHARDFAYSIHSDRRPCAGAKVNGRLVPLSTPLKNGDKVEIITDPHRTPSRDWLKFVKTARARTRIKQYIRTEERARSIDLARELLEKEGRKAGINVAKAMKDGFFQKLAEEFSVASVEELLSQVGYSRITPNRVLKRLYVLLNGEKAEEARTPDKTAALAAAAEEPKTKSKSRA